MMDNSYCQDYAPVLELDAGLKWVHKREVSYGRGGMRSGRLSLPHQPTDRRRDMVG
jgi:hypothetical protein